MSLEVRVVYMLILVDFLFHAYQSWQSLSGPSGYEDLNNISIVPNYSFDATKRAIASLRSQVEEVSKTEMMKISGAGGHICVIFFTIFIKSHIVLRLPLFSLNFHSEGSIHHARGKGG